MRGNEFGVEAVVVGGGAGAGSVVVWPEGIGVASAVATGAGVGGEEAVLDVGVATFGIGGSAAVEGAASPGPTNSETSNNMFPARLAK